MKTMSIIRTAATAVLALSVAAGLLSSCNNLENELLVKVGPLEGADTDAPVFYATTEGSVEPDTKVYTDAALHVLWNNDDYITIFNKTTRNKKFHFTGNDGANAGEFEFVDDGVFGTGNPIDYNYAVYPYDSNTSFILADGVNYTKNYVRAYFPGQQSYLANSFGRGANLMVAKSTDTDLSFKNVGGYLCFKLYKYPAQTFGIRSLILEGNNNEWLSGPGLISFGEGNIPDLQWDMENSAELGKQIVLNCETPVALGNTEATAVIFWMAVPPVTFSKGFKLTVIDSEGGIYEKSTSKSVTITRSVRNTMSPLRFSNDVTSPAEGVYRRGEDDVVKGLADQFNIYEYNGNAWVRLLKLSDLEMYEIGPIPLDAKAKDRLENVTFTKYDEGVSLGSDTKGCTVRSYSGGVMHVVSDGGDRYVFRF
jgi:hypothetical protein